MNRRGAIPAWSRESNSGLTLIETLISLSIAVIVLALVYSSLRTVGTVLRDTSSDRRNNAESLLSLNRISTDLKRACRATISNEPPFRLEQPSDAFPEKTVLSFSSLTTPQGNTQFPLVTRNTYTLKEEGKRKTLIRNTTPVRGPGSMSTGRVERLLLNCTWFGVSVLSGDEWHKSWGSDKETPIPEAARIEVAHKGGETNRVTVLIPAGNTVTSTLERASN